MKKISTILAALLLTASLWAQSPQKMSYQAVIRNTAGELVRNHAVGMKITILQGLSSVYSETQTPTTNANGLVSIEIGGETGFNLIDWSNGTYFIQTETDPAGGTNYTISGKSQLLSVPYALYAAKSGSLNYTETDPIFASSAAKNITLNSISNWNNAFGWGNHAGLYRPISYVPAWADITSKPTTLAGFGITNGMSTAHVANAITATNITNWTTAFGWGNHTGLYRPISYVPAWSEITSNPFTFSGPTNNQLLKYNTTNSKWENWTPNYLALTGTPASGDVLYYNGTAWITLPKGTEGHVLKLETGLPKWKQLSEYASMIPAANFTVSKLLGSTTQTIQVDASGVIDDVDPVGTLQVRWRWADGGAFTAWSTTKTASNIYATEGAKNITLEVKDSKGNVGTSSKAININNSMFMPIVFTNAVTDLTTSGAKCGGNIVNNGGSDITARGVCWAITQNPTVLNSKTTDATGIGIYSSTITGLIAGTTYYIRAYATNSAGTSYGNQVTFQAVLNVVFPTVTTTAITNITANAVTSGGNVTATGGADVTARGVCWSSNQNPTVADSKTTDGTATGQFQSQITNLIPGTYYARAYATNSAGSGYGNMVSFTTEKTLPVLTTKAINEISAMGAVSGGNISSAGGGTISGRGICWSDSPNPTITNEKTTSTNTTASFSAAIVKASPNTTYYLRAYATNEIGTGYGDQKTFTTSDAAYYTSYESGMTPAGWTGPFTVTNATAFDGSYSFMSLYGTSCDATFNTTLATAGQISFYYSYADNANYIDFYIDDIKVANFPNDGGGWRQGLVAVTSGNHTFKWHYFDDNPGGWYPGKCYIDQIIITK